MRNCQCPNCGANLTFDDKNKDFGFCQYCGTKIMLDDYRSTHRVIDEARIKEVESAQIIRLKEMEIKEKDLIIRNKLIKAWIIAVVVLGILGIIGLVIENESLQICLLLAMGIAVWGGIGLFTDTFK